MKLVYQIDSAGFWIGDIPVKDEIPEGCVSIKPPDGLIRPRFINGGWVEGATTEEINNANPPVIPNETEQLKKRVEELENALLFLMDKVGGI